MKYSIGHIYPTGNRTWKARVRVRGLPQQSRTFKKQDQARAWIDAVAVNAKRSARPLSPAEYYDAQRAAAILPAGVTVLDAARTYVKKPPAPAVPNIATREAVAEFLAEKAAAGRRKTHLAGLRCALRKLDQDAPVATWTPQAIAHVVAPYTPTTRNNLLRAFTNLFRWATARGYLSSAVPTVGVTHGIVERKPPPILTVDQTRNLLATVAKTDPELIPAIAIAAFAGIRSCELRQLWAHDVDLKAGHIHVTAAIAKTRQQRYVEIHPTLRAWLRKYPVNGPVCPPNWRKRITAARTAAGISQWPTNGHRHSYASYHLAAYQDAGKTAFQLGHPSPDLLYAHYRNLVTRKQGEAYFGIKP